MLYEIMLRGELDASWAGWFGAVDITWNNLPDGSCITILTFRDADQPALFGMLEHIRDLNLSLVSVNCIDGQVSIPVKERKEHMPNQWKTIDGNEAAASIAYRLSEVIAIYPITPSSSMGELADEWSSQQRSNLWGTVPQVIEMQSEGGAAGAVHGALQAGALATTFTSSQGLLLMIPNMYRMAGELSPGVFHVAARSLAAQALSIFGDHSDVMATRQTGFALLASATVQEAHDMALIAHAASLESRLPFLHFFDGFRTSREINKLESLDDSVIRAMIKDEWVYDQRRRALSPEHPVLRGSAQNPDVYFQGREAANPYYLACPDIVSAAMQRFAALSGRQYQLFEYAGAPDAERVMVIMGSGAVTAAETAACLTDGGEKVGVIRVHLYRPFSVRHFLQALPQTVRSIAVLDRTKEPGSAGEPLYQDVVTALTEKWQGELPFIMGCRYGLGSKEFTPAMVRALFEHLRFEERQTAGNGRHATIGIHDDVTHSSIAYDSSFEIEMPGTVQCVFWGLGSDGTVGANKNSIKIIGEETENYAQGYYFNDSKKSGSVTVSHLRFGPQSIRAPYLISRSDFLACHQFNFLLRYDVLKTAAPGSTFLLNCSYGADEVWQQLPHSVQQTIIERGLHFYVIDAAAVARRSGLGQRINTVMQTCFFAISGVLPRAQAIQTIKDSIRKTYGKQGDAVVQMNFTAVDAALENLFEVPVPAQAMSTIEIQAPVPAQAPEYVRRVLARMIANEGDAIPVSDMPVDGTFPTNTARWEKRGIASEIPVWRPERCIQCGQCVMVCPHAAIRQAVYDEACLHNAPHTFQSAPARGKEFAGKRFSLQIAPDDCTGCGLCVEACPVKPGTDEGEKAILLSEMTALREGEAKNWDFFLSLPSPVREELDAGKIKHAALLTPLFEFSGACAGCGETPYMRLLSQLFGDRMLVANATGCSSIYGGNLPTTPWAQNRNGHGPAWANSLFEDNAEFGLGMRVTLDKQSETARELLQRLSHTVGQELADEILQASQDNESEISRQRARIERLRHILLQMDDAEAQSLLSLSGALLRSSVWLVGGDGWAYDIGFGGLDHVLASGRNVNVLVLDTEVYSNTGGQASKSTARGAVARFAARGKALPKKDLGLMAMSYGYVYVARVAMGAAMRQTLTALREADAYDGPSLVIAYAHCIEHGIDMRKGLEQQELAVRSGTWPLYRFHPGRRSAGENPLQLDSPAPSAALADYMYNERRFRMLLQSDEERAAALLAQAGEDIALRRQLYAGLASMQFDETGALRLDDGVPDPVSSEM